MTNSNSSKQHSRTAAPGAAAARAAAAALCIMWKIGTKYLKYNVEDSVGKEIIKEFLFGWMAFFRDLPAVSITQLRSFGFSAEVQWYTTRRAEEVLRLGPPTCTIQQCAVCSGESRRWKLRKHGGWLIGSFSRQQNTHTSKYIRVPGIILVYTTEFVRIVEITILVYSTLGVLPVLFIHWYVTDSNIKSGRLDVCKSGVCGAGLNRNME